MFTQDLTQGIYSWDPLSRELMNNFQSLFI